MHVFPIDENCTFVRVMAQGPRPGLCRSGHILRTLYTQVIRHTQPTQASQPTHAPGSTPSSHKRLQLGTEHTHSHPYRPVIIEIISTAGVFQQHRATTRWATEARRSVTPRRRSVHEAVKPDLFRQIWSRSHGLGSLLAFMSGRPVLVRREAIQYSRTRSTAPL